MPFCSQCTKFRSIEEQEPEVDLDININRITGTVRIVNSCAECSNELTEANFDIDEEVLDIGEEHSGEGHDLNLDADSGERTQRYEGKGRWMKTFYGFEVPYQVTCECGFSCDGSTSDDIQASLMDQC